MEKNPEEIRTKKKVYVRHWRVNERVRRRKNTVITEYVKHKYNNIYHEALCFYDVLERQYPNKHDLRKTKEFYAWKETVTSGTNELAGTVQTLITETTLNEGFQTRNGLTHCVSVTVENGDNSEQSDNDYAYNDRLMLEIPLETYSSLKKPPANEKSPPPAETVETPLVNEKSPPPAETVETPLVNEKTPPPAQTVETPPVNEKSPPPAETVETPPVNEKSPPPAETVETPPVAQTQTETLPVNEIPPLAELFTEHRISEIIEELRNDPDLERLFNDDLPDDTSVYIDEGVEIPSLEEEIEIDYEPFDFDIEVEQDFYQW